MKFLLTTIVLFTTILCTAQSEKQPMEKIEEIANPDWSVQPQWIYYEKGQDFHFIKKATSKLETCKDGLENYLEKYENKNYEKLITKTEEERSMYFEQTKKHYLGAIIIKTLNDTISEYIKLNEIPDSDKFVFLASVKIKPISFLVKSERREKENPFNSSKPEIYYYVTQKIPYFNNTDAFYNAGEQQIALIQNLNTKLYYLLNQDALNFTFQNCENLPYGVDGTIYKIIPKSLTIKEKEILTNYKSLIKIAKSKTIILGTIQRKYLTKGYFDENRVNATDKNTYNKTLLELKTIAKQLSNIDKEDKDNKVQDMLDIDELATLTNTNDFNYKYYPIN